MSGELEARGYVVRGRVQGVGFRWFTQRAGIRLGLAGHVGNRPDGAVEVHARGTAEALQSFEAALRQGPAASRVDTLLRVPADPRTPEAAFLVEVW
ncbi:MAG: acylphosphatase [Longimicrobiales bacterium]